MCLSGDWVLVEYGPGSSIEVGFFSGGFTGDTAPLLLFVEGNWEAEILGCEGMLSAVGDILVIVYKHLM